MEFILNKNLLEKLVSNKLIDLNNDLDIQKIKVIFCIYFLSFYLNNNNFRQNNNNAGNIMSIIINRNIEYLSSFDKISGNYNLSIFDNKNNIIHTYAILKSKIRTTNLFIVLKDCYCNEKINLSSDQKCIEVYFKCKKLKVKEHTNINLTTKLKRGFGFIGVDISFLLNNGVIGCCI